MKIAGRIGVPIAYGFARDRMADTLLRSQIGMKLPASNLTPSLAMFGALFGAGKLGLSKVPLLRNAISHGKTIELSNFGRQLSNLRQSSSTGVTQDAQVVFS